MTKLYITEYQDIANLNGAGVLVPREGSVTDQVVDYSAGAAASSAFQTNTRFVRIHADSICSVAFGTAPTATTSNRRMAAGQTEYFSVPVGQSYKVSAVTNT